MTEETNTLPNSTSTQAEVTAAPASASSVSEASTETKEATTVQSFAAAVNTEEKSEQNNSKNLAKSEDKEQNDPKSENNTDSKSSTDKPESDTKNASSSSEPTPPKLNDVLPGEGTNIVYISGTVGGQDFDCVGPIEMPFKFTQPMWPYTPVKPNPNYKNQTFDYISGQWVPTDAKSQGQMLTNLAKKVSGLENLTQVAEQTQKATMQTTMALGKLMNKMDTLTGKIDALSNDKKEGAE